MESQAKSQYPDLREIADPRHTAVLVIDPQNDFCSPDGSFGRGGYNMAPIQEMLPRLISFVEDARRLGYYIIWIQQTTLPNGMSDSAAWRAFKTRNGKDPEYTLDGSWGQRFADGLVPEPGEPVVQKFRSSAFVNTTLDLVLRARAIQTVIATGVMSHGCVEATARHASYLDYFVVYLNDCVASSNKELYDNGIKLMRFYFPVTTSTELVQLISAPSPAAESGSVGTRGG